MLLLFKELVLFFGGVADAVKRVVVLGGGAVAAVDDLVVSCYFIDHMIEASCGGKLIYGVQGLDRTQRLIGKEPCQ